MTNDKAPMSNWVIGHSSFELLRHSSFPPYHPDMTSPPLIAIIMGSKSDWPTMKPASQTLPSLHIPHASRIVSAHRTPDLMASFAKDAQSRGLLCIIAGAGGAAHLPGMTAAFTPLPVIGVPVKSHALAGLDSLLSIAQMPAGVPVATVPIGDSKSAAHLAARLISLAHPRLRAD